MFGREMVRDEPNEVQQGRYRASAIQATHRSPEYDLPMGHVEVVERFLEQSFISPPTLCFRLALHTR